MDNSTFETLKTTIFARLEKELPSHLLYHSVYHTRDDVLPAVERLAEKAGIPDPDRWLLKLAALYHDVGYIDDPEQHEERGAAIAAHELAQCGLSPEAIQKICQLIRATKYPQSPQTLLEQLICDADLDSLGREDYFLISHKLRLEFKAKGIEFSLRGWYERQLEFMGEHHYWSEAARQLRDVTKQKNIEELKGLLLVR